MGRPGAGRDKVRTVDKKEGFQELPMEGRMPMPPRTVEVRKLCDWEWLLKGDQTKVKEIWGEGVLCKACRTRGFLTYVLDHHSLL